MTTSPDITDTQALTALRHDLKEILRVDALDCDGATTDALLVRAAVDTMTALHTAQARSDEYLDDAQRAGARLAELEAEAAILRQYAIAGATFAGMRDEIALPVGSWPHVGEFAAFLAGAVTMHRRMGGEQDAPNHLDADGRDASIDPRPGDVWVIDGRPWIVKDTSTLIRSEPQPWVELSNCDINGKPMCIRRPAWSLFAAPHTFLLNLNEPAQPSGGEGDPDRPSLAQVG